MSISISPERYESRFERFLPSFTLLVNAVYWEKRYPRFVTWAGLKRLAETHRPPKLSGIADITCDTSGSIECNVKSTDSDMPAYRVDPLAGTTSDGHLGKESYCWPWTTCPANCPTIRRLFSATSSGRSYPVCWRPITTAALKRRGCPRDSKGGDCLQRQVDPRLRIS
jgi:hypothetical protein